MQKQRDQRLALNRERRAEGGEREKRDVELGTDGAADALAVALAAKLRREDAGPGQPAEDAEVENEEELVHDGDAGHALRTDLADHDVVEQVDEVGDDVLQYDRPRHGEHQPQKVPVKNALFHPMQLLSAKNAILRDIISRAAAKGKKELHFAPGYAMIKQ